MAAGDEVEFVGVRYNSVAVAVQLLPRQLKAEGIVFRRAPVNAELKSTLKNTGFKVRDCFIMWLLVALRCIMAVRY